jgi:transcription antitermination factor NusG
MLRNWYAVYTMPNREKKVSALLSKKGIECYFPLNYVVRQKSGSKRVSYEPLFSTYVFVHVSEAEISQVKDTPGVMNLVYWKSKPAVISDMEIDAVKHVTEGYMNIRLEKSAVESGGAVQLLDEPIFSYNENSVRVKYKQLKINLPSLGITMVAEREKQKKALIQSEASQFVLLPRRFTAMFTI